MSLPCNKSVQKKKNSVNKNQGREPIHQNYKANENPRDTTQRKNKNK
jgi:hypothetical protein